MYLLHTLHLCRHLQSHCSCPSPAPTSQKSKVYSLDPQIHGSKPISNISGGATLTPKGELLSKTETVAAMGKQESHQQVLDYRVMVPTRSSVNSGGRRGLGEIDAWFIHCFLYLPFLVPTVSIIQQGLCFLVVHGRIEMGSICF